MVVPVCDGFHRSRSSVLAFALVACASLIKKRAFSLESLRNFCKYKEFDVTIVSWWMESAYLPAFWLVLVGLAFSSLLPISSALTDAQHVHAINSLYVSLVSPQLPGWVASGGDPCGENWQGVQCVGANITGIVLNAANLGGQLGDALENFTALTTLDLSNNFIGESIPDNLPPNLQHLFLSANQFSGSIPRTLEGLSRLMDMSLNANLLTGQIPNVFQGLVGLINLDLSSNNLSGQLPPTFGDLSSLATLHLQNNQLSGTLTVLEDLKLQDLNIQNNLFSGPVPPQLNNIPNFRKDGNPFNLTPSASPSSSPPAPFFKPSTSQVAPGGHAEGSTQASNPSSSSSHRFFTTRRMVGLVFAVLMAIGILILAMCICASWFRDRSVAIHKFEKKNNNVAFREPEKKQHEKNESLMWPSREPLKVSNDAAVARRTSHVVDIDAHLKPSPVNKVPTVEEAKHLKVPEVAKETLHASSVTMHPSPQQFMKKKSQKPHPTISGVTLYTISDLQQFTKSFGQANLIGGGSLGNVYLAELPDGKLLAVKKLDTSITLLRTDEAFLDLVSTISKFHHPSITKLVGYSMEHGQRILVYEYCNNGTLLDALHQIDGDSRILSWNLRVKLALGVAQALEYLHEDCQPPVVLQNLKSANILLDDDFSARLSDCGLASLFSASCASQVSSHMLGSFSYGAPEYTMSGVYNVHSDVYSFGVVMLELLTGRKPLDRTRPRAEQSLVRWATPQLHDIDALSRMVDPALEGDYSVKSLSRFADIISLCLQPEPEFRPPISEIVQALLRMSRTTEPNPRGRSYDGSASSLPISRTAEPASRGQSYDWSASSLLNAA